MSFCFCFRTFHFFCSIGLVLRPETAAASDINIEEPHEIPIPNISARWPTVEDTMLRDNSPTRNNADYQTKSKTQHLRAFSNHFHRLSLEVILSVTALDNNSSFR